MIATHQNLWSCHTIVKHLKLVLQDILETKYRAAAASFLGGR